MSSSAIPAACSASIIAVAWLVACPWASPRVGLLTSTPILTEAVSGGTLTDPCPLTLTVGTPSAMPGGAGVAISSWATAPPPLTALVVSNPASARLTASARTRPAVHIVRIPRCRSWGMFRLLSTFDADLRSPSGNRLFTRPRLATGSPQAAHPAQSNDGNDEPSQREGEGELRQAQPGRLGASRCRRVGIGCRRLGALREARYGRGDRARHRRQRRTCGGAERCARGLRILPHFLRRAIAVRGSLRWV